MDHPDHRAPDPDRPGHPHAPITVLLYRAGEGDSAAVRDLLPMVYQELRMLAAARLALQGPAPTLQATALVHEAYLKLVSGPNGDQLGFASRAQFFAAASRSMRNILVDHARARMAQKRGGGHGRVELNEDLIGFASQPEQIIALHELLSELESHDARKASIVSMRFFGGMTGDEIASVLGTSARTIDREWRFARAWMQVRWTDTDDHSRPAGERV